jgi:hypothetical protein
VAPPVPLPEGDCDPEGEGMRCGLSEAPDAVGEPEADKLARRTRCRSARGKPKVSPTLWGSATAAQTRWRWATPRHSATAALTRSR